MSEPINDGGPAYPDLHPSKDCRYQDAGMTLRDFFAATENLSDLDGVVAVAIAGPKPDGNWITNPIEWLEWDARWRSAVRYMRADAMLKAREAKP